MTDSTGDSGGGEDSRSLRTAGPAPAGRFRGWYHRRRGILAVEFLRTVRRALETRASQTLLTIVGLGTAVALMLLVTSVGLGLAAQSTVASGSADYWIVPESGASSVVAPAKSQRFGQVHGATESVERIEGVRAATPVLVSLVRINTSEPEPTYAFALGVVPGGDQEIAGLSTATLTPGDPYHDDGSGRGVRTGEAVLSRAAASSLGVGSGDTVRLASGRPTANRTFTVTATGRRPAVGFGQLPVLVVHLSELQAITGAAETDAADMFLVDAAGSPAVAEELRGVYPNSEVIHRSRLLRKQLENQRLPAAMSLGAGLVAIVVGTLVVVTAMGIELAGERSTRAVLAAVGVSARSRALMVVTRLIVLGLLGALLGVAGWAGAIALLDVTTGIFGVPTPPTRVHPLLVAYGVGVALLVAIVAAPYLLVTAGRTRTDRLGE